MSQIDRVFDGLLLAEARKEAKRIGLTLPTGICALKVGRRQYAVQADPPHNFDHYESASSVSEAKAAWINRLIREFEEKNQPQEQ